MIGCKAQSRTQSYLPVIYDLFCAIYETTVMTVEICTAAHEFRRSAQSLVSSPYFKQSTSDINIKTKIRGKALRKSTDDGNTR